MIQFLGWCLAIYCVFWICRPRKKWKWNSSVSIRDVVDLTCRIRHITPVGNEELFLARAMDAANQTANDGYKIDIIAGTIERIEARRLPLVIEKGGSVSEDRFQYRVWDNVISCYSAGYLTPDGILVDDDGCLKSGCVVEMCTGLRDKNGMLVYEGDIIHNEWLVERGDIGDLWIIKFGEHQTSDDYYASGAYGWYGERVGKGYDSEYSLAQMPGVMIVVGNIHERPELLEKAKM